jgi:carboxymethylenebutenolidase
LSTQQLEDVLTCDGEREEIWLVTNVVFPTAEGGLPGYLAVPEGYGPWPGIVVVHDILGVTTEYKRIARRFAASGYLALAPELYRNGFKIKCLISTIRAHFAGHGAAYDHLVAARDHLIADERCTGKIGLVGFCMGAGFCMQLAPRGLFDATAPNYGMLPEDLEALRQSCPVVASFGAKDRVVPAGAAAELENVLASGNVARDIKEYPNAGHSFMNRYGISGPVRVIARAVDMAYCEPEAEDAWGRMLGFFEEHLA